MNPNKKKKTTRNELIDLDIDRVDAVDKPATGRGFLLFKSQAEADAAGRSQRETFVIRKAEGARMPSATFSDIVFAGRPVAKGDAIEPEVIDVDPDEMRDNIQFEDRDEVIDREVERFDRTLSSWAGRATDATRRPLWAQDSFLRGDGWDQDELPRPLDTYAYVEPDADARDEMNWPDPTGAGVVTPGDFRPPAPKAIRMGNGYVMRRAPGRLGDHPDAQGPAEIPWTTLAQAKACGYDVSKSLGERPKEDGAPEFNSLGQRSRFRCSFGDLLG